MKIAVFYPPGMAAWSVARGLSVVFARMGHEITDIGERRSPSKEELEKHDVLFVGGPEYRWQAIRSQVPQWDEIKKPKIGWMHEPVEREDYYYRTDFAPGGKLPVEQLKKLTPNLFSPAAQDVAHGIPFMPLGVDTGMFKPTEGNKLYSVLFVGYMYPKRTHFLSTYPEVAKIISHEKPVFPEEYASVIGRSKMMLNLPSMSALQNARVYETMACKTALVTPDFGVGPENYKLFEDGKHLMYFKGDPMPMVDRLLKGDYLRESIAENGYQEVIAKHKLEHRLQKMLELSL
jgi:hypothetical protein